MAVYRDHDIVSAEICRQGRWEFRDLDQYGPPGGAVDVGGNIGYHSLSLAKAGWTVQTFEPLPRNLALIRASLCKNPDAAERISLHAVGLGPRPDHCEVISSHINVGDGRMRCGPPQPLPAHFVVRGSFDVAVLDDVLLESGVEKIDFLKIDVESMECQVFRGGRSVLSRYRPRLIQSEVWRTMQNCTPDDYLQMFRQAGYKVTKNVRCDQRGGSNITDDIQDFFMCLDSEAELP